MTASYFGLIAMTLMAWLADIKPPGRNQHAAVFDDARGSMLVYGGSSKDPNAVRPDNSLWSWTGNTWRVVGSGAPQWREDAKMVYHKERQKVYLYGGRSYDGAGKPVILDEFWEWDGKRWSQVTGPGPGKMVHTNLAYDAHRNKIVMFGGVAIDRGFSNDVWEWDGQWTKMPSANTPTAVIAHTMIYSPALKKILILGGARQDGSNSREVWSWNGSKFELLNDDLPEIEPGGSNAVCMDEKGKLKVVLFGRSSVRGGASSEAQTWLWDGNNWFQVTDTLSPPMRENHTIVYDPMNKRAVLFGGNAREEASYHSYDDTWVFNGKAWQAVAMQ